MKLATRLAVALACSCAAVATASEITVQIENLQDDGGFAFTPFWLGVHDGSFDVFESGSDSSLLPGITEIAELGDTSVISQRLVNEVMNGVGQTFAEPNGPPVFSPGESASTTFDVGDATSNRFLNYASMVVPSNDLFVGNDNAIELFDAAGNFIGPVVIDIFGADVYDNGSEINDISNGPAFVNGVDAMGGGAEGGVVRPFFTNQPADDAYLNSIIGTQTAPGPTVTQAFGAGDQIGRITITPEPATAALMLVTGVFAVRRRR